MEATIMPSPPMNQHGSVGAVIGVVAAVSVLGIIAGMIGRLCSGRPIMGYGGHFDMESWVETKCSSCVDGHVGPPPPRNPLMVWDAGVQSGGSGAHFPAAGVPITTTSTREMKSEAAAEREQEQEEERETSDEEQLHHHHRHRQEDEQHPEFHRNING